MNSLGDIARMAAVLPRELQAAQIRGIRTGALHVTKGIRGEIRSVTGDMRLSGVGRRGARVGARYDVKGTVNPTAIIGATGPMQLLEHPTSPHDIVPRRRKRGKKGALRLRNGSYARKVRHPGTKPSRPFERGYLKTRGDTGRLLDAEVQKAIVRSLRG